MVGPVASTIYVNQQMASVASNQNSLQNRLEFQNMVAGTIANEKREDIQEVRPTEENHEIDPDREDQKNEQNEKDKEKKEKQDDDEKPAIHKLDIKV